MKAKAERRVFVTVPVRTTPPTGATFAAVDPLLRPRPFLIQTLPLRLRNGSR